ncbi:arylsulfatase A-like enzyme [Catalinimonas alkaloidigena]|uniref:sulfatase n=1 Tax=Catalinimonas alkaloidigena TaxID=1075417 RepID=UPI0024049D67|nr:sulfatase [Catalinimonas alkaloidigena]MDF9797908.1 arylsulfatase A-like enzyme [Catalinimonas alkaloidigena]
MYQKKKLRPEKILGRIRLEVTAILTGLLLLTYSAKSQQLHSNQLTEARPNIIFVLADDLGWADINCFDPLERQYYETTNIDRLAHEGMKFTQAYTNAANCSPTRAALISGQYYPHQPVYHVGNSPSGKMISAPNAHELPAEKITIAEALREGGYTTALIGKWHIGAPPATGPEQQGFDINIGGYNMGNPGGWEGGYFKPNNNPYIDDAKEGEYLTDYLTRKAAAFIEEHQNQPFYLQLSYYTPHTPLQAPEGLVEKYRQKEGKGGHDNPAYAAMIESLDRNIGKLTQTLDELGLADNTIFIFYSDNGGVGSYDYLNHAKDNITDNAPLKGGKANFYEGGIRVPLIVRWPKVIEAGTQSEEPVIGIDFYPSFLEVANVKKAENYLLDGLSLLPLFENPDAKLDRESLYWHFPGYPNHQWRTGPVSVIRQGPWKLLKFYETDGVELYDLSQDMSEKRDLAQKQPEVRDKLQAQLEQWLEENQAPMPQRREEEMRK